MSLPSPFILFDDAIAGRAVLLNDLINIQNIKVHTLSQLDEYLSCGWQQGLHSAVFIPYEFGTDVIFKDSPLNTQHNGEDILEQATCNNHPTIQHDDPHKHQRDLTIYWFSQRCTLNNEQIIAYLEKMADQHDATPEIAGICCCQLNTNFEQYSQKLATIKAAIERGDFYQINYTTRLYFEAYGSLLRLYQQLRKRQPVAYGALAFLERKWTLCLSPELFFSTNEHGQLLTEPMKGTLPINDAEDVASKSKQLKSDTKNRAENLMIVDLLRNDLSRIAQPHGVKVDELFKVTRFGQVLQMTTPISAQLRPHTTLAQVLEALFPCGSITGAPKIKSMEYIAALENEPRALYTGSIGLVEPTTYQNNTTDTVNSKHLIKATDGSIDTPDSTLKARTHNKQFNFKATFNVAIRTLQLPTQYDTDASYKGVMGVGGGIVYDSNTALEYDEIAWKAQFIQNTTAKFKLFETMLVAQGQCDLLDKHVSRLFNSAQALGFKIQSAQLIEQTKAYIEKLPIEDAYRVKLLLDFDGSFSIEHSTLVDNSTYNGQMYSSTPMMLEISTQRLPINDCLRRFKTTYRHIYDNALAASSSFDVLFLNHDGHLLEGARSSVFIKYQDKWLTPPLSLDILPGVMRAQVLQNPQKYFHTKTITEELITQSMLENAQAIKVTNALRGVLDATLISKAIQK